MKKVIIIVLLILLSASFSMVVFADEEYIPDEYEDILDAIPEDIAEILPDGIFSKNITQIGEAVQEVSSWKYLIDVIFDLLGMNFGNILRTLVLICALLILCSLINMLKGTLNNSGSEQILRLIGNAVIITAIIDLSKEPIKNSIALFDRLKLFVNTSSPVLTSMYAMGGNVGGAVVNNFSMIVFLSILENVCIIAVELIIGICFALTFATAFMPNSNLSSLNTAIKKTFSSFIGIIMIVFSTVISSQTLLASRSDTLSSKTAKALVTQIIPLVGSTVGESLRLAGASIEYLRANVGIALIIILILIILPTLISIVMYRLVFTVSVAVAGLLGCEREGRMISEISSIYGYIIAIISISAIILLFLITLFAKCASPIK